MRRQHRTYDRSFSMRTPTNDRQVCTSTSNAYDQYDQSRLLSLGKLVEISTQKLGALKCQQTIKNCKTYLDVVGSVKLLVDPTMRSAFCL